MEPASFEFARRTVKHYLCSTCWEELEIVPAEEGSGYLVLCKTCKKETKGYVTRGYVERRRAESAFEAREATRALKAMGILPSEPKTSEQSLHELGF